MHDEVKGLKTNVGIKLGGVKQI